MERRLQWHPFIACHLFHILSLPKSGVQWLLVSGYYCSCNLLPYLPRIDLTARALSSTASIFCPTPAFSIR